MRGVRSGTLILLPARLGLGLAWSAAAAEPVDYGKNVKSVLNRICFASHGTESAALSEAPSLRLPSPRCGERGWG